MSNNENMTEDEFLELPEVAVKFAIEWTCPHCNSVNVSSQDSLDDLSDGELDEIVREKLGLDDWQEVTKEMTEECNIMGFSAILTCENCQCNARIAEVAMDGTGPNCGDEDDSEYDSWNENWGDI